MKRTNNGMSLPAEIAEGRPESSGNLGQPPEDGTQHPSLALSGLARVREAAQRDRKQRFTSLMHHITPGLLMDAFQALKRWAAPGVDGVTWSDYEEGVHRRILDLHGRVQSGTYRAQPSQRAYIPKADGRQRPLGIAALEDKIVQKATVWVLESIYEVDYAGFSYGFRPGRGQHNALDALYVALTERPVNWIVDADIKGFFDAINHQWLMTFLEHRIADPRMLRMIKKWLRAGVNEDGEWKPGVVGTPQGAVISPLLANVYLHYVLDLWMKWWRKQPQHLGDAYIVRYADDFVVGFTFESDALRFLVHLRERLTKFGLELHPEKTRLIEFGRYATRNRHRRREGKPETFAFLGFTHICGKRRKDGQYTVLRHSMPKRMGETLQRIRRNLRRHIALPVGLQGRWLGAVVRGWLNYHAIPTNSCAINRFRDRVIEAWRRVLRRRSQTARRGVSWEVMRSLAQRFIPDAHVRHPYPNKRFCVRT